MSLTSILSGPEASQPSQPLSPPMPKASPPSKRLPPDPSELHADDRANENENVLVEIRNGATQNGIEEPRSRVVESSGHVNPRRSLTMKENTKAAKALEALEANNYSDVEDGEASYRHERELFRRRQHKRSVLTEHEDDVKRKVCPTHN